MDGWMDGWMDEWMDGYMDRWTGINGCNYCSLYLFFCLYPGHTPKLPGLSV